MGTVIPCRTQSQLSSLDSPVTADGRFEMSLGGQWVCRETTYADRSGGKIARGEYAVPLLTRGRGNSAGSVRFFGRVPIACYGPNVIENPFGDIRTGRLTRIWRL